MACRACRTKLLDWVGKPFWRWASILNNQLREMWQKWASSCKVGGICFAMVAVLLIQEVNFCRWTSILVCVSVIDEHHVCVRLCKNCFSSWFGIVFFFAPATMSSTVGESTVHILEGVKSASLGTRNLSWVAVCSFSLGWMCLVLPHRLFLPCKAFLPSL